MNRPNIGWLFYRDYYSALKDNISRDSEAVKSYFESKNRQIINQRLSIESLPSSEPDDALYLKTTYPGLIIGTGYQHETASLGEFKIGFYFDYSSGLPVIPGSSVKGVLRSVFPYHKKDLGTAFRKPRINYIRSLVKAEAQVDITDQEIEWLEREIFEGKDVRNKPATRNSVYQRDIFYDAVITDYELKKTGGKVLGSDFITPHDDALKDPNPLQMLRVVPGVVFRFSFQLQDSVVLPKITATHKRNIFRKILLARGVGAKTNVGYGQFDDATEAVEKSIRKENQKAAREDLMSTQTDLKLITDRIGYDPKKENRYTAKITDENEAYYQFTLENGIKVIKSREGVMKKIEDLKKRRTRKGQSANYLPLNIGGEVIIRVNEDKGQGFSFAALPVWL